MPPHGSTIAAVFCFSDLPIPCGKVTVVLLHNILRFAVGCHERLHIGITVLSQNIGQFIQLFIDFLFCPLYLLCERLAHLALENSFCVGELLFQFRKYRILQMPDFPCQIAPKLIVSGTVSGVEVLLSCIARDIRYSPFEIRQLRHLDKTVFRHKGQFFIGDNGLKS